MTNIQALAKQVKYDMFIFFREPFFALPILLLPAAFFGLYASMFVKQGADIQTFGTYIPMYILLISFLTVFFNIGTQYVTDKELGVIKRFMISPMKIYNIIASYIIRGVIISILGYIEMMFMAHFVFHIPLSNNMPMFFLIFIVIVGIMLLFSIALHGFFKNSRQVIPFTIIMFQYVLFASGMMFPVDQMAKPLRILVYMNPIYHMNHVLTNIWYAKVVDLGNVLALAVTVVICLGMLKIQKGFKTDK